MEEIIKSIKSLQFDASFVEKIQDFVNKNQDPTHVQRILSFLYTQSSSRIKDNNTIFVGSVEQSVVLLIKCLLTKDLEKSIRTSTLRTASNFAVVFHQQGYDTSRILDTSVSCVVSLIQENTSLNTDQSLTNLITLQTSRLSKSSEFPTEIRHKLWNHLFYLYKPIPDKTKLISLLPSNCYNPSCDIFYLKSCMELFTRENLLILIGILDKYCAYYLDKRIDSSQLLDISNTILNNVINDIECFSSDSVFESTLVLIYKYSFERTFLVSQSSKESIKENLAVSNSKMKIILELLSIHEKESERYKLSSLLMMGMLNHLGITKNKYASQYKEPSTVDLILDMFGHLFKLAKTTFTKLNDLKGSNQNLFRCWCVFIYLITENLNEEHLHMIDTLIEANNLIISLLLYKLKNGTSDFDGHNLNSFIRHIGVLVQSVNNLDMKNKNNTINPMLVKSVLSFFLAIPEHIVEPVAEVMMTVMYSCLKSSVSQCQSSSLLLECLEPVVLLACRSLHLAPYAANVWIRLQNNHRRNQPEHEWVHLCDHVDRILPHLRLNHKDVTFVDTSGPDFVLRVLKHELDELFVQQRTQPEEETCGAYESSVARRVLLLVESHPAQDLALADVCLSCIFLIFRYEKLTSECDRMKSYVAELKKVFKTMKSIAVIRRDSELGTEQRVVTDNTLACLLLSNYYVLEHMQKVHRARAEQKKLSKSDDKDSTAKKRVMNDVDKGIEQDLNETNVFPSEIDDSDEMIKVLDTVALVLSKVIQTEVQLDLNKILSVIKIDRFLNHLLYVGYSYRLFLEGDKEVEFWKLCLKLSVLLNHDGFFVECVSNLIWLDEGLRPAHLKRADDIVNTTTGKSASLDYKKTVYLLSKVKQMLSLNEVVKASEALEEIKVVHKKDAWIYNILPLFYHWYLKCEVLMKQPELTPKQHAYIVQCCDEAFNCLFWNFNTVSHTNPVVLQVISSFLDITKLIIKFHTAHLNPKVGRQILSIVLRFTQEMCLPLWTAQLLSLSAGLDVMTCNKQDLHFKTSCLEQILIQDISLRHSSAEATQLKLAQISKSEKPNQHQQNVLTTCEEAMRDAVVTKQTIASSSLASPRFVSTLSDKLPRFIAHRSCRCFQCRNSVYQELLVSLELLRGLYYQLQAEHELTAFCFHNAEHLLSKLKILKGLPDSVASLWQGRIVFYRANLAGIMKRPCQVLKLNEEYQMVTSGASEDYFVRHCDFAWQQEQFLMFMADRIQVQKPRTPPRKINFLPLPPTLDTFKTPKVSKLNIGTLIAQNTMFPACKLKQDVITPRTSRVGETLVFDKDTEDKCDEDTGDGLKENTTPKKKNERVKGKAAVEAKTTLRKPRRVKLTEPVVDEDENWSPNIKPGALKTNTAKKPANQKPPIDTAFTPIVSEKFTSTQLSPTTSQSKQNGVSRKVLFENIEENNKLNNNNVDETMKAPKGRCKPCQGTSQVLEGKRKPHREEGNVEKTSEINSKTCNGNKRNITNPVASKREDPIKLKNYKEIAKRNTGISNKKIEDFHVKQLTKNISDLKIVAEKVHDLQSNLDVSDASSYHSSSTSPEIIRPTRSKALPFDDDDMDIDEEKEDETLTNNKLTSTRETNSVRTGQKKAPLKSVKSGEKDMEPVKALPTKLYARIRTREKTDVVNTVKSISSRTNNEKLVAPIPTLSKAVPRRPVRKPSDTVNVSKVETKQLRMGPSLQYNANKVEISQTSRKTVVSSRKAVESTAPTQSSRMSSRSKSSNTSESSHSSKSLTSSERSSSSFNSSETRSLLSSRAVVKSRDASVVTVSSGGSVASDLCTGSSQSDTSTYQRLISSGSLVSSSSPSSVESLVTNARTGGKSRCRKVQSSSSSCTLSSASSRTYQSSKSDSFYSVEVDRSDNEENKALNTANKVGAKSKKTEALSKTTSNENEENEAPNKAKKASNKDNEEKETPIKVRESATSAAPRSERTKRKPRAQLPKNPFIF